MNHPMKILLLQYLRHVHLKNKIIAQMLVCFLFLLLVMTNHQHQQQQISHDLLKKIGAATIGIKTVPITDFFQERKSVLADA